MTRKRSSCDARLCRAGRPASGRRLSANVARLLVWAWLAAAACTLPGLCLADEDEDATPVAGAAVQPDRPAALALTGMFGVAGGAVRLERRVVASRVKEPAAPRSADGRPLDWQRAMVWLPRGRHELGWGVAVPAAAVGAAGAAPAATAAAVGGATAPVASDAGLLLLGAGRIFGSGVSVRMGVSVPLSALGPAWVNAAPTELAAGDAAGATFKGGIGGLPSPPPTSHASA